MAKLKNKVNYLAMLATAFGASDVPADEGKLKAQDLKKKPKLNLR